MHDLLNEPLIGLRMGGRNTTASLPEVLSGLCRGDIDAYTGQRAHQVDPWHVFTVQIAASILARQSQLSTAPLPNDALFWREELLALSEGQGSAWHLIEPDVTKPAFLQHPLSTQAELSATFKPESPKAETPDELDVLLASKNHDLKGSRGQRDDIEMWLYAVLTYQTTSGFLGSGQYGVVRMNSGFGSRSIVGVVSSMHPAKRFIDDVLRVCELREAVLQQAFGYRKRGVVLTALTPWERSTHQWMLSDLEPWFIEACRALRLSADRGRISALGASSKARQIGPKDNDGGDFGDPWTVVNTENKKGRTALNVDVSGWTPALVTNVLFESGFEASPLQRLTLQNKAPLNFVAGVLARGQGSTEGFHRLILPLPPRVRARLMQRETRESLGKIAQSLLLDVKDLKEAVRFGLTLLTEGGPDEIDRGAKTVNQWVKALVEGIEQSWSSAYFDHLWRCVDEDETSVRYAWRTCLMAIGRDTLERAVQRLPQPSNRRWRARVRSQSAFGGGLRKKGWTFELTEELA